MAHAYNPSNTGGRNQEDYSSKPALANSSQDSISKTNTQHKSSKSLSTKHEALSSNSSTTPQKILSEGVNEHSWGARGAVLQRGLPHQASQVAPPAS
jgi:hypothetical protein